MRHFAFLLMSMLVATTDPAPLDQGATATLGLDIAQFEPIGIGPESITTAGGEVRLSGRPLGYLATRADHGDFALSFEWRYDRPEGLASDETFRGNSGVLLRIARPHKVWPDCIQLQLAQADAGSLFAMGDARIEARSDPRTRKAAIRAVGQWNRSEITCRGTSIVSILNGVEVARGEGIKLAPGPIGWQSEGQPIRFREIRVKKLD